MIEVMIDQQANGDGFAWLLDHETHVAMSCHFLWATRRDYDNGLLMTEWTRHRPTRQLPTDYEADPCKVTGHLCYGDGSMTGGVFPTIFELLDDLADRLGYEIQDERNQAHG